MIEFTISISFLVGVLFLALLITYVFNLEKVKLPISRFTT